MRFLTIDELKATLKISKLSLGTTQRGKRVLTDDPTQPTFMLKVAGDFDSAKPMRFMHEDDAEVQTGCLVNVAENAEGVVIFKPLATVEEEL